MLKDKFKPGKFKLALSLAQLSPSLSIQESDVKQASDIWRLRNEDGLYMKNIQFWLFKAWFQSGQSHICRPLNYVSIIKSLICIDHNQT